jgi:hypothetical protein
LGCIINQQIRTKNRPLKTLRISGAYIRCGSRVRNSANCGSIGLGDNEHPDSVVARTTVGKRSGL